MRAKKYRRGDDFGTAKVIDCASVRLPELECDFGDESVGTKASPRFDTQVRVRVITHRLRLTDADNCCSKYAIDGLVEAGILRDDSPKFVASVTHEQVKVQSKSEEKTVIEIVEVERD